MPSSRSPPPGLGIATRRTGLGRYSPLSSSLRMRGQCSRRYSAVAWIERPSTPAAPLFALTRFQARTTFPRVSACTSRVAPPEPSTACVAGHASPPRRRPAASPPSVAFGSDRSDFWCTALPRLTSFDSLPRLALRLTTTRPLLTSHSASLRRTFVRKARSPRVGTHSFTTRPPDLRRRPLTTRASRSFARSP